MTPAKRHITVIVRRIEAGEVFYIQKGGMRWEATGERKHYRLVGKATNGTRVIAWTFKSLQALQREMRAIDSLRNWREVGEV